MTTTANLLAWRLVWKTHTPGDCSRDDRNVGLCWTVVFALFCYFIFSRTKSKGLFKGRNDEILFFGICSVVIDSQKNSQKPMEKKIFIKVPEQC